MLTRIVTKWGVSEIIWLILHRTKMEAKEIQQIYASHPGVTALMQLREEGSKKRVLLEGLLGSASAMVLCGLRAKAPEQTFLVVMNDAEEAGYFYHDFV